MHNFVLLINNGKVTRQVPCSEIALLEHHRKINTIIMLRQKRHESVYENPATS